VHKKIRTQILFSRKRHFCRSRRTVTYQFSLSRCFSI